jgi:NAD dependent epimerase/dehydratase family enzyme
MTFPIGVPAFVLKGVLGEFGTVLLDGQRVYPQRLLDMGFSFTFPTIEVALNDLIKTTPHK